MTSRSSAIRRTLAVLAAGLVCAACESDDAVTQPADLDGPGVVALTPHAPAPVAPRSPAPQRDDYAYWQALDDAAIAEYTSANAFRMLAVATGDHAAAFAANVRHDEAYERHMVYSVKANAAWNRERGVRATPK